MLNGGYALAMINDVSTGNKDASPEDIMVLVRACTAGLYKYDDGVLSFNYADCFECGTCRVLSYGKVISKWTFPNGLFGIEYRF
jgi:ferredoxin-like protein FixX